MTGVLKSLWRSHYVTDRWQGVTHYTSWQRLCQPMLISKPRSVKKTHGKWCKPTHETAVCYYEDRNDKDKESGWKNGLAHAGSKDCLSYRESWRGVPRKRSSPLQLTAQTGEQQTHVCTCSAEDCGLLWLQLNNQSWLQLNAKLLLLFPCLWSAGRTPGALWSGAVVLLPRRHKFRFMVDGLQHYRVFVFL